MTSAMKPLEIFAPAKINLFLHVTGRNSKNYHLLQSLVAFADFGDKIIISPSDEFKFSFDSTAENLPLDDNNLVITATNLLCDYLDIKPNVHIHLNKNIPIGAGLGGGSSDAAATIKGLLKFFNKEIPADDLNDLLLSLGADVPVCYHGKACYFDGIGENITPIQQFPTLHALLVYPSQHCATQEIFAAYDSDFSTETQYKTKFQDTSAVIEYLEDHQNNLTSAAVENIPDIQTILTTLQTQDNVSLTRMSGSGSCCFALFENHADLITAKNKIHQDHDHWWIQDVLLS